MCAYFGVLSFMNSLSAAAHPALRVMSRYRRCRRLSPPSTGHDTERQTAVCGHIHTRRGLTVANYPRIVSLDWGEEAGDAGENPGRQRQERAKYAKRGLSRDRTDDLQYHGADNAVFRLFQPSIFNTCFFPGSRSRGSAGALSQLAWGKGGVTPWTSR